jgi:hypothetical protein
MFKIKLGAIVGFALGWLVGSGRAAKLWDEIQGSATRRAGGSGPVAVPDRPSAGQPSVSGDANSAASIRSS